MTCWISLKSRPFEATPDATMTSFAPDLNDLMAYSRSSWAFGRRGGRRRGKGGQRRGTKAGRQRKAGERERKGEKGESAMRRGEGREEPGRRTLGAVDRDGLDALEEQVLLDVWGRAKGARVEDGETRSALWPRTRESERREEEEQQDGPSTSFLLSEKTMHGGGVFCRHSSR